MYNAGQAAAKWGEGGALPGRFVVGAWRSGDAEGVFMVADQQLSGAPGDRGLAAYVQAGAAEPLPGGADGHLGAGLVVRGPLSARRDDAAGVGVTAVHLPSGGSELAAEGWYRAALAERLSLHVDVQGFTAKPTDRGAVVLVRTAFTL